ncbi:MAG: hypothetical protein KGJ93_02930 [Patescibacteria group bacterium]|nr:hypothetical protein [Patescibacteria group bacterium]
MKRSFSALLFFGLVMGLFAQAQQPQPQPAIKLPSQQPLLSPFSPNDQRFELIRGQIVSNEKLQFDPSRRAALGMVQDYVLNFGTRLAQLVLALGQPLPAQEPQVVFLLTARTSVGDPQFLEVTVEDDKGKELQKLDHFRLTLETDIPAKATAAAAAILPFYMKGITLPTTRQ